ncbi:DEAD/DEAH box helicase [Lacrimispora xylanisolvens]|uniref:DEAD/DEAH box helicase n=1 Tax=Lacrimispora xylanisolvens TaxID=384636 RepID=UPI0032E7FFF9
MSDHSMELFQTDTRHWFERALGTPTLVQKQAWPEIAAGRHTLVSAPTGTGKTLTAFLIFLDRLLNEAARGELKQELQLIYISPLKSLAGDIRENLRRPLEGIVEERKVRQL